MTRILTATLTLTATPTATLTPTAEESLAGHWTRALARHARSSIALLDALCAVPRFYNTLLDCPDAPRRDKTVADA